MPDNFNYISFGNPDYVVDIEKIEISRRRMFEHTPTELAKRLEELEEPTLDFIEKLPTFFCSEISRSNGVSSMVVRFGRVSNLKVEGRVVFADFKPIIEFGEVLFENVDQAIALFGSDSLQLYRTHWAVREGKTISILKVLANIKPEFEREVSALEAAEQSMQIAHPPEIKKNIIGTINSVEGFLEVLEEFHIEDGFETFYRGHENSTFELTPSLFRKWPDGSWQIMPNEDKLCKELLIAHYDDFQGDQYCFDRLVRMQHFGLPTRLLDISGNPLVALFFSCYCSPELIDVDGEVIIFVVPEYRIKYFDSDTVSCISNLSQLSHEQKNAMNLGLDVNEFRETPVAGKLLHHIKSEKGFFEPRIVPDDLGSILCVKAKQTNTRIKSQVGAFLLFGHEAILPESGQDGLEVARITVTKKLRILRQLAALNINATTVYPSIEQTAKHVKARYQQPEKKA